MGFYGNFHGDDMGSMEYEWLINWDTVNEDK